MIKTIKERIAVFNRVLDEVPEVRYVGDAILRQQTQTVTLTEGKEIGEQLGKILLRYREIAGIGRGLAAPQIGLSKAVFITFVDEKLQIFINPSVVEKSPTTNLYKELCLSSGIIAAEVERPEWVVMRWTDEAGVTHREKIEGFLARLYQHEEAHLRGVINLDQATTQGIEFVTFDPLQEKLRKSGRH